MTLEGLLGKTYDRVNYNCAHFVRDVWKMETGEDIGDAVGVFLDQTRETIGLRKFKRLEKPESPCIVMMRHGIARPHVAVFVRDKIIQIREHGASMFPPDVAVMGYSKIRYYK